MAKLRFKDITVKKNTRKPKRNWKLIAVVVLILGNFAWDAYNRVEEVKLHTDKLIQQVTKE